MDAISDSSRLDGEGRSANRHQTWSAGCDGRGRVARRMTRARTAKACGPDAPWLASSLWIGDVGLSGPTRRDPQATVTKRSWTPGRARSISCKPSRGEGRVAPVEPVVNVLMCFFTLHMRLRVQPAPGLPCALCLAEGRRCCKTRADRAAGTNRRDTRVNY